MIFAMLDPSLMSGAITPHAHHECQKAQVKGK